MSTHNICFRGQIRKNVDSFFIEKIALAGAMEHM